MTKQQNTTDPDKARVRAEILAGSGLSLTQTARKFPSYRGDRPVNPATVWRWVVDGVRIPGGRVRLAAARIGGRWLTSEQALARFIDAQTPDLDATPVPASPSPKQQLRAAERASAALDRIGI